jgi:hypothetical protein
MNVWRRGSLLRNPYLRNAFRVARVPRESTNHRTIVQLIGQTRRAISTDPAAHRIAGTPVTLADLNAASDILLNGRERMSEELLHHATEKVPLDRLRALADRAARSLAGEASAPPSLAELGVMRPWLATLVRRFLDQAPRLDPAFGAQELDLVSPLGDLEEE